MGLRTKRRRRDLRPARNLLIELAADTNALRRQIGRCVRHAAPRRDVVGRCLGPWRRARGGRRALALAVLAVVVVIRRGVVVALVAHRAPPPLVVTHAFRREPPHLRDRLGSARAVRRAVADAAKRGRRAGARRVAHRDAAPRVPFAQHVWRSQQRKSSGFEAQTRRSLVAALDERPGAREVDGELAARVGRRRHVDARRAVAATAGLIARARRA